MRVSKEKDLIEFIATKEYRKFSEFCDACRRYRYIGLCYGPPGVGKTLSARKYALSDVLDECFGKVAMCEEKKPPKIMSTCRTVLYTPPVSNTPKQINAEIEKLRHRLKFTVRNAGKPKESDFWEAPADCTELIIVDEADRLKLQGLEQVRDIFDKSNLGLVFIGMPGLEKRLSRYPQLYSRVGFVHEFRQLSQEEIIYVLEHKWLELGHSLDSRDVADGDVIAAIMRITQGNFRLLQRLFLQAERVMKINGLTTITKDVVEAARENLVIGMI